jgi:hypothetical protein
VNFIHRNGWAEGLFAHAGHRVVDVEQDGGLEEFAVAGHFSAGRDRGSVRDGIRDVTVDDLALRCGGQGADVRGERTVVGALPDRTHLLDEQTPLDDEFVHNDFTVHCGASPQSNSSAATANQSDALGEVTGTLKRIDQGGYG